MRIHQVRPCLVRKNSREENRSVALSLDMRQLLRDKGRLRQVLLKWSTPEPFLVPIRAMPRVAHRRVSASDREREIVGRRLWLSAFLLVPLLVTGCATPAVRQQRLVARPNMLFSDSAAFTYNSPKLLPQLAPGFAGSGGAQNSGCTSCR